MLFSAAMEQGGSRQEIMLAREAILVRLLCCSWGGVPSPAGWAVGIGQSEAL